MQVIIREMALRGQVFWCPVVRMDADTLSAPECFGRFRSRFKEGGVKISETKHGPVLCRTSVIGFIVVSLSVSVCLLFGRGQTLTGDEPRYLMYAVSLWRNGRYVMSLSEWQQLYQLITGTPTVQLPAGGSGVLMNGVYLPTILAPIGAAFKLAGLRATTLIAGLIGLFYLLRLCRRFATPTTSVVALGVGAFSIPLLPYLHLFYMETFFFALICCAWERLQTPVRSLGGTIVTGVLIMAIPFVHMRGSMVAAALFLVLLWQQYRLRQWKVVIGLGVISLVALASYVSLNIAIYGGILGPVNTARPPTPGEFFPVLAMQLFNVRHGLLAYAPVWVLGYAGLWAGSARKIPIVRQALVLAIIAALTGVGINPGECWPARFWVQSVPMLVVGLSAALELGRSWIIRGIAALLICATLVNTAIFLCDPNLYLENRQTSVTYQELFNKVGHFNFGLVLPVEVDDKSDVDAARDLAIGASAIVVLLVAALAIKRQVFAMPALLLMFVALDFSRMGTISPRSYNLVEEAHGFRVVFDRAPMVAYVQFGNDWETWFVPPTWTRFSVTITGTDGRQVNEPLPANQVIAASCSTGVQSITVQGPPSFNFDQALGDRIVVYHSASFLERSLPWLRHTC